MPPDCGMQTDNHSPEQAVAIVGLSALSNIAAWWTVPDNAAVVNYAVGTIAGLFAIGLGCYRVIRILKGYNREL